ncbi:MAG: copper resistance CopC family protein, partial [Dehalococcoidia bacterium]
YGRVLLLKLLLVAAALALALASRLRALSRPRRLVLLRRLTRSEGAVLVGVVAVTAVLVNAAPPRDAAADAELLGPAPLTDPVVRMADLAGQLAVFVAAAEGELQVRIIAPDSEPAGSTRVRLEGRGPSGESLDLYPRSCGRGCFSMGFAWQDGITHLTAALSGGTWSGGTVQFGVPWPPGPEDPELLDRVIRTMRAQPEVVMTEQVSSGPDATAPAREFRLSGEQFVQTEVYAAGGATDIRRLPEEDGLTVLSLYIPGSFMWYQFWIDADERLRRQLIINPGHRIERRFAYGAGDRAREHGSDLANRGADPR